MEDKTFIPFTGSSPSAQGKTVNNPQKQMSGGIYDFSLPIHLFSLSTLPAMLSHYLT